MIFVFLTVAHGRDGQESPPEALDEGPVLFVLLGEVDEAGEGQDRDSHEHDEEAELFVRLLEGGEQRLEAGEMAHQLEHPEDASDADQPHDLAGLADNVQLREVVEHEGEKVGEDGEQIHQVEGLDKEEELARGTAEADHVLDGEEHGRERVDPDDCLDGEAEAFLVSVPILAAALLTRGRLA